MKTGQSAEKQEEKKKTRMGERLEATEEERGDREKRHNK